MSTTDDLPWTQELAMKARAEWEAGEPAVDRPSPPGLRRPSQPPPRQQSRRWRPIDYPRAGRSDWRRWIPSWKLVAGAFGGGFVFFALLVGYAYANTTIPTPNELAQAQTTIVYYADGKSELGRFEAQNRTSVPLAKVPLQVRQAVLAAEDRSFYENNGVNPKAIARALLNNLRGGDTQGGSTITQQYTKNFYLKSDQTVQRKIKEFFISIKLDQQLSKDEILENYLNTIYFGKGAWGIQAAARTYFGKNVERLTVAEGALLAGIIQRPSGYDPEKNPEAVQRRWSYVLDGMLDQGWLTATDRIKQQLPKVQLRSERNRLSGQRGYLMDMVEKELAEKGYTREQLERGGYRIRTTFSRRAMLLAQQAVKSELPKEQPAGLRAALVTVSPQSGAIVGLYAGEDYTSSAGGFNNVIQGRAQAGSTFKPFALTAALEQGISLRSRFDGANNRVFNEYEGGRPVPNFDNESFGMIDLVKATESSVNTVYIDLTLQDEVRPKRVMDAAIRAGVPKDTPGFRSVPSITLGTASVHPLDMAMAYATFAAGGMASRPFVIADVTGPNGGVEYTVKPERKRVFEADVMADLNYTLQQVVKAGSGAKAQAIGRPSAGKTGTTNDNKSAWYVGYTPQLSTAVAMFRSGKNGVEATLRGTGGRERVTGGSYPAAIWTTYMTKMLNGMEVRDFPEPKFVGETIKNPPPPPPPPPPPAQVFVPRPKPKPKFTPDPTLSPTPFPRPCRPWPKCLAEPTPTPTITTFQPGPGGG
jgi:membrane peptidoglycan carboxypeptidase